LLWLAKRVAGWGRVYIVEALCRHGGYSSRSWLLRNACDGDFLDGYFAGQVATTAHLHEAITSTQVDDDLVDHTGRLLKVMADCGGMGMTLEHYPPAPIVLASHAAHLGRQTPTADRYFDAAVIADHLAAKPSDRCGCTTEQRDRIVQQYLTVLDQPAGATRSARASTRPATSSYLDRGESLQLAPGHELLVDAPGGGIHS